MESTIKTLAVFLCVNVASLVFIKAWGMFHQDAANKLRLGLHTNQFANKHKAFTFASVIFMVSKYVCIVLAVVAVAQLLWGWKVG